MCLLYILLREPPLDMNPNSFHETTNKTRTRSRRKLIKYFVQTSSGSCSSKCFSKGDSSSKKKLQFHEDFSLLCVFFQVFSEVRFHLALPDFHLRIFSSFCSQKDFRSHFFVPSCDLVRSICDLNIAALLLCPFPKELRQ